MTWWVMRKEKRERKRRYSINHDLIHHHTEHIERASAHFFCAEIHFLLPAARCRLYLEAKFTFLSRSLASFCCCFWFFESTQHRANSRQTGLEWNFVWLSRVAPASRASKVGKRDFSTLHIAATNKKLQPVCASDSDDAREWSEKLLFIYEKHFSPLSIYTFYRWKEANSQFFYESCSSWENINRTFESWVENFSWIGIASSLFTCFFSLHPLKLLK